MKLPLLVSIAEFIQCIILTDRSRMWFTTNSKLFVNSIANRISTKDIFQILDINLCVADEFFKFLEPRTNSLDSCVIWEDEFPAVYYRPAALPLCLLLLIKELFAFGWRKPWRSRSKTPTIYRVAVSCPQSHYRTLSKTAARISWPVARKFLTDSWLVHVFFIGPGF